MPVEKTHFVSTDFELSYVPGRVVVSWPLDVSPLSLIRGVVVMDIERNFDCTSHSPRSAPSLPSFERRTYISRTRDVHANRR